VNSGVCGSQVSADIQTTGSCNNGGPAIGSTVLFTWQTKNNTGKTMDVSLIDGQDFAKHP